MKISTSATVAASREQVFAALNDRAILRRAIPGCESLTDIDEDSFRVELKLGIAGIKGSYSGTATRQNVRPPESLTLAFDGKGKGGWVRGTAAVKILEEQGTTRIASDADVQIGGVIAAVGSRLIDAASRKLTGDFFRRLSEEIGAPAPPDQDALEVAPDD